MMLYCGCSVKLAKQFVFDRDQGKWVTQDAPEKPKGVTLGRPMRVDQIGVEQFLADGSRHYPNVDIRACPKCGSKVVIE